MWAEALMSDPRLESSWSFVGLDDLKRARSPLDTVIVSYPDDEGVRLNKGRAGAASGPERILFYLGRTVALKNSPQILVLNLKISALQLADRHTEAEQIVRHILRLGYRVITLGGGHDYGYPDAAAFLEEVGGKVLNVDAHLDLRPVVDHQYNSGTPFRRLVERFGGKQLIEWGYLPHTNSEAHESWGRDHQVKLVPWPKKCPELKGRIGLSICLDAFAGIRGVSAPTQIGPHPNEGWMLIRHYAKQSRWLGLYEAAPSLDPSHEDSARLAAALAHAYLHGAKK
jgi:arginase family enzyme